MAAEELEDSNSEKLAHILRRIKDPFLALDERWHVTYANKEARYIIGSKDEKIVGKVFWEIYAGPIIEPFSKACMDSLTNQKEIKIQIYYPLLEKWYEHHIYPSLDGLSIYYFDITDKKREEENLKIIKSRLTKAEEIGNLGYWELAHGKDKIWGSEQTLKIFGFNSKAGEVPIHKVEALIHELNKLREANATLIQEGKKYNIRLTINPADGSPERIISVIADTEKDVEGNHRKVVGVIKDITRKIKAEIKLVESYKRTASILESIDMAFFLVDSEWKIKIWNNEAEKDFSTSIIEDSNIWDILPKSTDSLKDRLTLSMRNRETCHFEDYFPTSQLWMRISCFPFEEGLSIFLLDITDEKRKENLDLLERDALDYYTNKEANVEDLLKILLDGLKKIHPDMFCSVLRYKDGHLYNWSSSQLPEDYNKEVEGIKIGLGNGSCGASAFLQEKVEVTNISTHAFWREYTDIMENYPMKACTSYPIVDSRQNLLGTFGIYFNSTRGLTSAEEHSVDRVRKILVNIVEKKLIEDEARKYKNQLELIFNTSIDIIFLVSIEDDDKYRLTRVNNQYLKTVGQDRTEVEGKLLEEVIPDKSLLLQVKAKYKEAITTGKTVFWEYITPNSNGANTSDVYIAPIMNARNECKQLIGYVHDTTAEKKSKEELKKANEDLKSANENLVRKNTLLEEIAWITSHNVRTPIARILGLTNLLINYDNNPKERDELIKYLANSANELDETIQDVINRSAQSKVSQQDVSKQDNLPL